MQNIHHPTKLMQNQLFLFMRSELTVTAEEWEAMWALDGLAGCLLHVGLDVVVNTFWGGDDDGHTTIGILEGFEVTGRDVEFAVLDLPGDGRGELFVARHEVDAVCRTWGDDEANWCIDRY